MRSRTFIVIALAVLCGTARASSDFLDAFVTHYKLAESSKLAEKSCALCHVSDEDFALNPFGIDMKKEIAAANADHPTEAVFVALDKLDSDGDGTMNGEEIAAVTFPGDAASGGKPGTVASPKPIPTKKPARFPPKNGYHPAIVHFPIGLFIGGLVLDAIGLLKGIKAMLLAGWYNIVLAAISSMGGIASGLWAMSLMKLPYRGLIFDHLLYAIGSTAIMWTLVAMRVHRHEKMNLPMRVVYYLLAAACLVTISWAGHLGGVFVYGE
ncbi:MAG TPA: hypothetical protein PLL78_11625 [Fimbriimonadaceae bacterium]|nr:hypothetical protein [Fimbriimonadaceae bacterium]HRJ97324.1 hypothetical protein [Fimbriimonadaceae bacterium]